MTDAGRHTSNQHDHRHNYEHGDHHVHRHAPGDAHSHTHHHPSPDQSVDARLSSIGIDIGSATTHFVVSELAIGRRDTRIASKPEILERTVTYASPVLLTPYLDAHTIDAETLERFIIREAHRGGIDLARVDTGAVICTGEASRKVNAATISERITRISGNFVCAAAGHHLEAILGAHGSGAVELSRRLDDPVVLADIGGGTVKRTVLHGGRILQTAAMNVGSRLVAFRDDGVVLRIERAGAVLAAATGVHVAMGAVLSHEEIEAIAARMARHVAWFLGLAPALPESAELMLTGDPSPLPVSPQFALAGGTSDYFFGRSRKATGDLGLSLAGALKRALSGVQTVLHDPGGGIRATVVGAGQYALQVSGETIFTGGGLRPPLTGLAVRTVAVPWADLTPDSLTAAVGQAVRAQDRQCPFALAFGRAPAAGYSAARTLGAMLGPVLAATLPHSEVVLIFEQNIGGTVGRALFAAATDIAFMCLDEIRLGELDFIDIGPPPAFADYIPVTVKTLAFDLPRS
jgi:ethanolamine utilization protein EutA